jgi:uncharacterized protein (TIGR02246 family)
MFERFTEKARRVIFFARYEASQYGSMSIETEHLLLGLFREDHALARKFLSQKGGAQSLRDEIESQITRGERLSTAVEIPISAECKRILNKAAEEAERLGSKHIGPEHILLGILHEPDCLAARLLHERGLTRDWLREELARPSDDPQKKFEQTAQDIVSVMQIAHVWGQGQATEFARMFAADGQFVDPQGNLWIGPARIHEAARLVFAAPGWAKSIGKIEDVQFVGSKAALATLVWESSGKLEKPNPSCVRMTVILTQKLEGWSIVRVQATGLQPQSRSATV